MRISRLAPTGLAAIALVVAACGSASSGNSGGSGSQSGSAGAQPAASSSSAGTAVKTMKIGKATVLANAKGFTLYWFVPDTSTTSKCTGTCAKYWPPVAGPATGTSGISGKFATITRTDGSVQATYGGHPLYTYVGDTAPGQAKGNGLNLSGGVWHEVVVSGSAGGSGGGSGGGGGYSY